MPMTPLQSWAFLLITFIGVYGVVQIILAIEHRYAERRSTSRPSTAKPTDSADPAIPSIREHVLVSNPPGHPSRNRPELYDYEKHGL
jgi:hypothetical protein